MTAFGIRPSWCQKTHTTNLTSVAVVLLYFVANGCASNDAARSREFSLRVFIPQAIAHIRAD